MNIKLSTIIEDCSAQVHTDSQQSFDLVNISEWVFDTRKINEVHDSLFLCLAKHPVDIIQHVRKAEEKGIRVFLIPEGIDIESTQSIFLQVPDVMRALQEIAAKHRHRIQCPCIGITGSNGKTIIKEWLSQLLEIEFKVTKSPASYNSQLGVPLSVLLLENDSQYGVFEAGISRRGEMSSIEKVIQCDLGILTNIGDAHSAGFDDQNQKLEEKLQLFKNSQKLIFEEYDWINHALIQSHLPNVSLISWSIQDKNGSYYVDIVKNQDFVIIHIEGKHSLSLPFYLTDKASIKNVIHVIIAGLEIGLHPSYIIDRVKYLEPVSMRLVLQKAMRNCILIDDSYNADLTSLENALDFANEQRKRRALHLILTDFDQVKQNEAYYQKLSQIISRFKVDRISYVGQGRPILIHSSKIAYYTDLESLKTVLKHDPPKDEAILLKGARRFQLDALITELKVKSHRTELLVDLNAIAHNVKTYRSLIKDNTHIMAVIKAGAYGSDSVSLAKHLLRCGIQYLAVAYYDEAIELREEGISAPIMVMNPDPSLSYLAEQYELELEIYSVVQLQKVLQASSNTSLKIHLKIDSGMHRLGIREEDLPELIAILQSTPSLQVKSIFSHLSSAEDPKEDDFTEAQHQYYERVSALLLQSNVEAIDPKKTWRHICNSNAALRFPAFHHDMIRLGIGLYGYISDDRFQLAHCLKTYVAQVKDIQKGDSVGYNRSFIADRNMRVATLCIGYADGISRKAGNGQMHFKIQGQSVPTIGNISMDTCSVDVTDMQVESGDEVIIFDTIDSFNRLCKLSDKTAYECISGIGPRVVRTYVKE